MSYYYPHSTDTDRCWRRVMHLKTPVSQTPTCRAANATPSYNLPSTNENHHHDTGRVELRGPSSSSLELSTVTTQVCRSYRNRKTHSRPMLGPNRLCAAVFVRHRRLSPGHPEGWQGKVGHRDGMLLLATDAARQPGLNVVLCGDMEQQRLNYLRFNQNSLRLLTLFWQMTDIALIDVCSILCT